MLSSLSNVTGKATEEIVEIILDDKIQLIEMLSDVYKLDKEVYQTTTRILESKKLSENYKASTLEQILSLLRTNEDPSKLT